VSARTVLLLAILIVLVLWGVLVAVTARRRDERRAIDRVAAREEEDPRARGREVERVAVLERQRREVVPVAEATPPPAEYLPPDPETLGVTRRQFLNRGVVTMFLLSMSGFGAAMLAQLWPNLTGGFGSKIKAGALDEILEEISSKKEPFYVAAGRFYIAPFPKDGLAKAKQVQAYGAVLPGYEKGVVALYQKCVHLGCRVPWCKSSQWFECPCHGSQYNRVGEKKGGPAPRGLDRFPATVEGGSVFVDTKTRVEGPPIGTNTTGQEAEGPHCVGAGGE
jgi:cytochrome b6-f complex iron-sulfur subunit